MSKSVERIGLVIIAALTVCFVSSCDPSSKQKYLDEYKKFVDEVSKDGASYSDSQWQQADKKHEQFSVVWYAKFKEELNIEDKLRITGYRVKYSAVKASSEATRLYQSYLKKDVDELKRKVKYYVENDMEEDLQHLLSEAKKVSKDLYNEIKDIIEEVKRDSKK